MIQSMTAFARQERVGEWGGVMLELRSVNHRYLEISMRLPEELRSLEAAVRSRINSRLGRGKVDCFMRFQPPAGSGGEITIDHDLATQLAHASREIDTLLHNAAPVSSTELLKWPGVLQLPDLEIDTIKGHTLEILTQALDELIANRKREGEEIRTVLLQRCTEIERVTGEVREILPTILKGLRQRLRNRLAELKGELDEGRIEQEMVIQAQKLDVEEELDRLHAHINEVTRNLNDNKPVGRRLDFLMQELNREANTLGSKSANHTTSNASVDLKVLIEQMREQIQNIE